MDGSDRPEPVRASGRQRQPNKKYNRDEITDLDILASASEEEGEVWQRLAESSNDEDFDVTRVAEEANDLEEDEISSATAASDGSGIVTPPADSDDATSYASKNADRAREDGDLPPDRRLYDNNYLYKRKKKLAAGTHGRGIGDPIGSYAKGVRGEWLYSLFGDAPKDLVHAARTRDQWSEDVTLPRRPTQNGRTGMRHHFSHTNEIRRMEGTEGWNWYYVHGGRQRFGVVQNSHPLSPGEGIEYVPQPSHTKRTVFMGPYGRQFRFDLRTLQSMSLDEAWKRAPHPDGNEGHSAEPPKPQKRKDGWLVNVGTGVRCVDWAPNHAGGTQYLALSTLQPIDKEQIGHLKFSPAFTAQSFPSSIQIWSFSTSKTPSSKSLLSPDRPPCLRMIICTDWGDAKHLTWCPMPRDFRGREHDSPIPVGLLAGVWSDGHVRVLDVYLEQTQDTTYVKYTTAAFTAKPPSTLCTCVTWLSSTELAVGCANGYLA
ncbi:MAG: hypothetical protein L6R39_003292, partial [Caloplaca ligustica]